MKGEFEIADQIAFFQAATTGNTDKLKSLIEKGVKVNFPDKDGNTPLHFASLNNNTESVRILLNKGVDRNFVNLKGETALQMTQRVILNDYDPENNYEDTIELLSAKEHISGGGVGGIATSAVSHYEFAKALQDGKYPELLTKISNSQEENYNFDSQDIDGSTMLHYAVKFNKLEIVNNLLTDGASLDIANKEFYTPLDLAILYGNNEIIKVLLKKELRRSYSATSPDRSNEVDPYLIKALIFNRSIDEDLIIGLISKMTKDDLDSKQIDGKNFLEYATENSRSKITEFLVEKIFGRDDYTTYADAFPAGGYSRPYADEFEEFEVRSGGGPAGGSQKRSREGSNSHFEARRQPPYASRPNDYLPSPSLSPISFEFYESDYSNPPSPTSRRVGGSEGGGPAGGSEVRSEVRSGERSGVGPAGGSEVRSGVNFLKPPQPPPGGPRGDCSVVTTNPRKREIDNKTPPPVKSGGGGRGN